MSGCQKSCGNLQRAQLGLQSTGGDKCTYYACFQCPISGLNFTAIFSQSSRSDNWSIESLSISQHLCNEDVGAIWQPNGFTDYAGRYGYRSDGRDWVNDKYVMAQVGCGMVLFWGDELVESWQLPLPKSRVS